MNFRGWSVLLPSLLVLAGCGGSDDSGGAAGTGGAAGGGGSGSTDPLVLVPPEALSADKAADCPASFQTALAAGQSGGYDAAGQTRSFYLALPTASFDGPRPLMVVFNGTGETGKEIFDRANMSDFVDAGFVVLAPDSAGNGTLWPVWDGLRLPEEEALENKDLEYFDSIVKCVAAHQLVDKNRIYVSGHSAGGIFTNRVLRARSDLLAGGIPASGVFDYTAPDPAPTLDGISVLVTWGGDNDEWGGNSGGGVAVPKFNFVEQAALASQHYESAPGLDQAYCRGSNVGHAWLSPANSWMIEYLLGHPKGLAATSPWQFVAPTDPTFTCSADAATFANGNSVTCGPSSTTGCQAYCQMLGDCAVENATIEPVLGPQLDILGFSGTGHLECGGCVTKCEADATDATDATTLGCFQTQSTTIQCGGGIAGASPFIDAVNQCCEGQTTSGVCQTLCGAISQNSAAAALFPTCAAF